MSENQPVDAHSEDGKAVPASPSINKNKKDPSKKRSFDTFYLFCVFLLALALGTQIIAIAIYS
ncbi:MAG: hypothetical protein HN763_04220 [Opitutales bacterium]|nr:hypothetical protein [Opitutales bacterium]MBT7865553.1 hypothetical protein [Opitutales bacterium]